MKPICVKCERFFRVQHNGEYFVESMPVVAGALPGKSHPKEWRPYKLWSGDLWECSGCGAKIIVGVGAGPIAEQHEPEFLKLCRELDPDHIVVNDC